MFVSINISGETEDPKTAHAFAALTAAFSALAPAGATSPKVEGAEATATDSIQSAVAETMTPRARKPRTPKAATEPVTPAAAPEVTPVEVVAPATPVDSAVPTETQVADAVRALAAAKNIDAATTLLNTFGVAKARELPIEKRAEFIAAAVSATEAQ